MRTSHDEGGAEGYYTTGVLDRPGSINSGRGPLSFLCM